MDDSFDPTAPCTLRGKLHASLLPATAEDNPPRGLRSKADFLHAVETVAGDLSKPGLAGPGADDMETIFVACPCDTWKQAFGELRDIQAHHVVACHLAVQAWEQPCSDGTVHCVGYFVDDPQEGQWVVLTRVCLF